MLDKQPWRSLCRQLEEVARHSALIQERLARQTGKLSPETGESSMCCRAPCSHRVITYVW